MGIVRRSSLFESGPGIMQGWRDLQFNADNVTAFITAVVFSLTGAVILFANVALKANLSTHQAASWVMSSYLIGGTLSIIMSLYYKQPYFFAPSLSALLIMGSMFTTFTLSQMVAGYLIAGVIYLLVGISGLMSKIAKYLPVPIIMGMIAGIFMTYGIGIVNSVKSIPLIGGITVFAFLLTPLITKKIPQMAVTLIVGILLTFIFFKIDFTGGESLFAFQLPISVWPTPIPSIILSVSIPLVLMGLSDTFNGYGVLKVYEYEPPLNSITVFSGLTSIFASFFLCHNIMLAGPVTAIIAGKSAGPKESRYVAAILTSLLLIVVGILSGLLIPFLMKLPSSISTLLAGLAMLGLFTSSLEVAFSKSNFQIGAFTAFIVALSKLSIFGIGAPVWAILFGIIVSLFLERTHFKPGQT